MEKSWATVKLLSFRRKEKSWATPEAESHFDWWKNLERHLRLKVISTSGEILGDDEAFVISTDGEILGDGEAFVISTDGEILSDTWDFWNEDVRRNLERHLRLKVISTDGEILGKGEAFVISRIGEILGDTGELLKNGAESHFDWWRNIGRHRRILKFKSFILSVVVLTLNNYKDCILEKIYKKGLLMRTF